MPQDRPARSKLSVRGPEVRRAGWPPPSRSARSKAPKQAARPWGASSELAGGGAAGSAPADMRSAACWRASSWIASA
eukprot:15086872-Alexandrium_andersonii.AAC.1